MREPTLSCRSTADLLVVCRDRGISLEGLTDGLDLELATLRDPRASVPWRAMAVVFDRLAERLGGPEAYGEAVTDFFHHPQTRSIRRLLRLGSTPVRNYHLVFDWAGVVFFPFLEVAEVHTLDDHRLLIVNQIPEHLPGSLPFLHSAVAFARKLPTVHGLPEAHVDAVMTSHRVEIRVDVPRGVSWLGWLRRWTQMLVNAPGLVEEVIARQQELELSNRVLEEAHAEALEREQQLQQEIEAREAAQRVIAERDQTLMQAQRLESIGRLAGGVAHDFNNLLAAILGQTEVLLMDPHDDTVLRGLENIQRAGLRGAALTRQLLTFAKRQPIEPRRTDVVAQVRGLEGLLRRLLQSVDVAMDLPLAPIWMMVDPVQLEQVLVNLAINARDAMPEGGRLSITVAGVSDGGRPCVRLTVEDTGMGMDADVQERLFEPFFTTKGEQGTGLGLSTAYGIVIDAGGRIAVSSERSVGSRFDVYWPCGDIVHHREDASAHGRPGPTARGARVLVVDDDELVRALLVRMLGRGGFQVFMASNGAEALAVAQAEALDLVVSDVMLLAERGPAVVKAIRVHQPGVPVLYVSGYGDPSALKDLGDGPLLAKPFAMNDFLEQVHTLLA